MSTDYFNTVYGKLGVLLTDDDLAGESMYQPLMDRTVERLAETELLQHSDGALVVFPPGFTNRDGEPLPLIIQAKPAGSTTPRATSPACSTAWSGSAPT